MHRRLITLYATSGNRSAALRQYETCVVVLERELGVPPLPKTRAAYEAARDGHPLTTSQKTPKPEWATLPGLDLPLIGREIAWKRLETAYGRFHSGGIIFISGEPGVGKSRLMQTFATDQSSLVLTGNSYAGSQTLPYQPLLQALRLALPLRDRWQQTRPIWLAEVARLLPEISLHFPNLPSPMAVEPAQAQSRLFEAMLQLFRSLATDTPLLLCLDDVHWADEATRGWLHHATRQLSDSNICILATYRTNNAVTLREWHRSLVRADLMADVKLDGLSQMAIVSLLYRANNNDDIAEAERLATRIRAATGGNAFFVLETVREMLETNQLTNPPANLPLPSTVRETVLRRVGRLMPLTQQILEITAVLSPLLTFPVINQVAGRGDIEAADSLEELIAHQLLLADGDQFRFQHDLAREAVYQNISNWRRRLLHRRAATVLENLPIREDAGLVAMIATHFETAGDMGQAITYYRQAATLAQSLYAHQEAIGHLKRAIELAIIAEETAVLSHLYEALADNLAIAGEFPAAEEAYRTTLALTSEDEPLLLAELERKLASTQPSQQRLDKAENLYRVALGRLDGQPPTDDAYQWKSTQLNILLSLMDTLYLQKRSEAMAALKERTQKLLDEVGTPEQLSNYHSRLNQISFLKNRFRVLAENINDLQTVLTYAQKSGNARLIARQQFHQGFQLLWYGNLGEAEEYLQKALTAAEALGDFWLQEQCLAYLNILYRLQGNVTQVAAQLPHLFKVSQSVGYNNYIGVAQANTAWLHYCAGEWAQAQTQAQAAVTTWAGPDYPLQWLANWILLALALRQYQLPNAIGAARAILDVTQQKLLDEVDAVLQTAVTAWEANDEVTVRDCLETAVELASQTGYL